MWSHCKFISTDGTGHDSVNRRFESKLTQFGWETTKKGSLWRGAHIKGFQAFSGSGSITCFITFPDSSTKYFETPAIQIGAVLEREGGVRTFCKWCHMIPQCQRDIRRRGKRRGDKICSRCPCPMLALFLPIITYLSMFSLLQSLSGTYRSPSLVIPIPVMFHSILRRGRLQRILWE